MATTNIVLVHASVEEFDVLRAAFKQSVVVRYGDKNVQGVLSAITAVQPDLDLSNISHLALVYHPLHKLKVPFFLGSHTSELKVMSQELLNFISHLKGDRTSFTVDLLACSLSHLVFASGIRSIEQQLNIEVRYSLDDTGNATNWVLESHHVDIKDHYFNDSIDQWNHTLYPIYASASTRGAYAPLFKMVYDLAGNATGQVERLYQTVDINGIPINVLLDDQGINVNHGPGNLVQMGDGDNDWFGDGGAFQAKFESVKPLLTNVKSVVGNDFAYAALKTDGSVVTWGYANWNYDDISDWSTNTGATYPAEDLVDVKALYTTEYSFAALKNDGTVVTWGGDDPNDVNDPLHGGDSLHVKDQLTDVTVVFASRRAFAALKSNGTVVTWGRPDAGGDSTNVQTHLTNVVAIYSARDAFAALKSDGKVVAWGQRMYNTPQTVVLTVPFTQVEPELIDVVSVHSTEAAFAALKTDGSVVTWGGDSGSFRAGGDSSGVQTQLHDVVSLHSTITAFAAVKADGSVVTWGHLSMGGDSSAVQPLLNVATVYRTRRAFAALKNDGSVVTWGRVEPDPFGHGFDGDAGDSTAVQPLLQGVVAIYSAAGAFAALKNDGTVVTWGAAPRADNPSDSTAVQDQLTGIVNIHSNEGGFAAVKADRSVVTWGSSSYVGDFASIQSELIGVKYIFSSPFNMVALVETPAAPAAPSPPPNPAPGAARFAFLTLVSAITRSSDSSVYIADNVQIKLKVGRFSADDAAQARDELQDWIAGAQEITDRTAQTPLVPDVPTGGVVRVFTAGDTLFVHDQSISLTGLSEDQDNVTVYSYEGVVYRATVIFFGGSGGAEISIVDSGDDGAQTFVADQVVYASTSSDGNVTIFAGIVSQGSGTQAVSAPRVPAADILYTSDVSVGVSTVNEAVSHFTFSFDVETQQVTMTSAPSLQLKSLLSDLMFSSSRMSRNERQLHAENCLMALTDQIANDIPDEFSSGEEAMRRLQIGVQTVDEMLQAATDTSPMHALVQNVRDTAWAQDEAYSTYGSSLLRNIILSLCVLKPSRVQGGKAVFAAGDEIVFYVTFTGVIRVSAGRTERFGLSQNEIELNQAALDDAAWVKYRCRLVR